MKLRTPISIAPSDFSIDYSSRGLLLGSCFADQIGRRMRDSKLAVELHPFGILFNPSSIARTLWLLHEGIRFEESDLTQSGSLWVSLHHHGSFNGEDRAEVCRRINHAAERGGRALREADYVVITLGTAWIYEERATGRVVANCHKLPAERFSRRLLTVEEITAQFHELLSGPLQGKRVMLTVSPIRHLSDGLPENQLSKSILIVATHALVAQHTNVRYFPSYEILMDDLRDYRFYERDMVHPSEVAVDYIWELFCDHAISQEARQIFPKIQALHQALAHRPLNPGSEAHRAFLRQTEQQLLSLRQAHPELDWSDEQILLNRLLNE